MNDRFEKVMPWLVAAAIAAVCIALLVAAFRGTLEMCIGWCG